MVSEVVMARQQGIVPPRPLELAGNVGANWKDWRNKFKVYLVAMDYEGKSSRVKTGMLLNTIGDDAIDLFEGFEWADEADRWTLERVFEKFEEHCGARKSTFRMREDMWKRKQKPGQTVDQFLPEIRRRVKECNLGDDEVLKNSLITQRLMAGILDDACRKRMSDKGDALTLDQAIRMTRNAEATDVELKELGCCTQGRSVHAVNRRKQPKLKVLCQGAQWIPFLSFGFGKTGNKKM